MKILDDLPVATITFIVGCILTVIAFISNEINYLEAMASVGALGVGSGGIGYVRNGAGKGVR